MVQWKRAEEITGEAQLLAEMKPRVRPSNLFGDDNHAAIEVQMEVLNRKMNASEIANRWGEDGEDADDDLLVAALDAHDWYTGSSDEGPPSEGWKDLVN